VTSNDKVCEWLHENGPTRASRIEHLLQSEFGLTGAAARKRISRAIAPIHRFPVPLLPAREAFLYLEEDRNTEQFWANFQRDLRETNSIFGIALDAIIARGGIVRIEDFPVISGAPVAQKRQVPAQRVLETLARAECIEAHQYHEWECLKIKPNIGLADVNGFDSRLKAEGILLDAIREWARKLGLASYNAIAIRGDHRPRQVGPFTWDLTGPSYLLSFRNKNTPPGFFVADVFAEGVLDEHQIKFFVRKAQMLKAALNNRGVLPLLVAENFTGAALTYGHGAGVVLATPTSLFGARIAAALHALIDTLKNAAATVTSNPGRLIKLLDDLTEIEGKAGNLRGILFHLMAAHLARRDARSIDIGVTARDDNGRSADIDILKITHQNACCVAIECKGKNPGGMVDIEEVQKWLSRTTIMREYFQSRADLRGAKASFEIWTSGAFHQDAIALLESQKLKRTKAPIGWRDGEQILELARESKEKAIKDELFEHFIKHPLAKLNEPAIVSSAAA
jgi:hypothetical protein